MITHHQVLSRFILIENITLVQKKKIIRIVIFCVGVFILFNVILLLFPFEKKYIYKDKERGEEYIYSRKKYPVVFVGSGLIGDLSSENLGRQAFYNLFFPYGGSCTGIELIALSKKIPDTLFIETNYIFKGFNEKLNEKLFEPFAYRSKFVLPCLYVIRSFWDKFLRTFRNINRTATRY